MTKKKQPKKTSKRPAWIYVTLIVTFVVITYIVAGGINQVKQVYYGHQVKAAFNEQANKLETPLNRLGLVAGNNIKSTCENTEFAGYDKPQLLCVAKQDNYVVITKSNKNEILSSAKELDSQIKNQGGNIVSNAAPSFEKWFAEITSGIDYNPDITGTVMSDNKICDVAVSTAYSKPKPPAYRIALECNSPLLDKEIVFGL